jgi:hypothetical protein
MHTHKVKGWEALHWLCTIPQIENYPCPGYLCVHIQQLCLYTKRYIITTLVQKNIKVLSDRLCHFLITLYEIFFQ